ncbi:MAG: glycoside hydrolase family 88 protein [Acidobacteria bacterium]|nr:glycoside hydrolase family 88 protein [Acidobacteriota bacterium]
MRERLAALCFLPALLGGADSQWRAVADRLIQTPPESYPFNWGEGVQQIGLMKVFERTHDMRYAGYVEKWAALYVPRGIGELLNIGPKARGDRPGYCGHWSPATAVLYLYQARKKPEHLRLAQQVAAFIREDAERSPEGALGHWQGSHQLWVDTLYMACPLLAGLGFAGDAADQIVLYARHLQDPRTGLFHHMWDWRTNTRTTGPWARGNGWVLMSLADTIERMDRKHPSYAALQSIAAALASGLRAAQDREGMWRTVLDDPASYPESSATAMFCYGLLKLVRLKVLPDSDSGMARRAWSALNETYVKDGVVTGVSAGTDPQGPGYYRQRPVGTQTWGTGAYLMAGSEAAQRAW